MVKLCSADFRTHPSLNLNSEIETTDSADFADFEKVIGAERTNLFVANLQGIDNRNLFYPCNLRNLWLNPFRFLGLTIKRRGAVGITRAVLSITASGQTQNRYEIMSPRVAHDRYRFFPF